MTINKKAMSHTGILLVIMCAIVSSASPSIPIKDKPIAVYHVGMSRVVVWENLGPNGPWKNFEIEKAYQKDGEWRTAHSFSASELLDLRAALDEAIRQELVRVEHPE